MFNHLTPAALYVLYLFGILLALIALHAAGQIVRLIARQPLAMALGLLVVSIAFFGLAMSQGWL
jgi:hypothetical protein